MAGGVSIGFTGYGSMNNRHHIGPELQIGHRLGNYFEEPILLIKTAWGGKSLHKDFRPPSAGGETGKYYQKMLFEVKEALDHYRDEFPTLKNRIPKWGGFIWFQGWNDMFDPDALAGYENNLVHLVQDLRVHFKQPDLPVVVGELGNMGEEAGEKMKMIRMAQRRACEHKEWKGTVSFVKTTPFARPKEESPPQCPPHARASYCPRRTPRPCRRSQHEPDRKRPPYWQHTPRAVKSWLPEVGQSSQFC